MLVQMISNLFKRIFIIGTIFIGPCVQSQQIMVQVATAPPTTTGLVGQSQTFWARWTDGAGVLVLSPLGDHSWSVNYGTVTQSSDISCAITWTGTGIATVVYEMTTWNNYYYDDYQVVISGAPPTPTASFTSTLNCHATTIQRSGTVPPNVQWYWQTSSSGTSTSLGFGSSITRTTPGELYLRARLAASPFTWSLSSQYVGNIEIATPPQVPVNGTDGGVISNSGGEVNISVPTVPGATSYAWFNSPTGGTAVAGAVGRTYTASVTQTTDYYVESRDGNCPSESRRKVTAFVYPEPEITISGVIAMGQPVQLGVTGSFSSYQWRRDGGDILGATSQFYETNVPGTYSVLVTKQSTPAFQSAGVEVRLGVESQNVNYIITNTILVSGKSEADVNTLPVDERSQSTQYFDALGRLIQTVVTQGSPKRSDIIQPIVYDEFGREAVKYLPYVDGNSGMFKTDFEGIEDASYSTLANPHFTFYQSTDKVASDTRPYAVTTFEASPLSRPLQELGAGENWITPTDEFGVDHAYLVNIHGTDDGMEQIIAWQIDEDAALSRAPEMERYIEDGGFYATGQILIKMTKDEDDHIVREYTDKLGRVILKKVQAVKNAAVENDDHWAQTYYIYDDFGNLVMVLPPEAVKALINQ